MAWTPAKEPTRTSAVWAGMTWGRSSPWVRAFSRSSRAEEGAAAVEAVGALVEGEADGGADHGVGLEAVGVEHGGVDEFLDFAGPVGDGGSEVLSGEDALGELFF
jgi:hypothetical protein